MSSTRNGWKETTLGECADWYSGGTPRTSVQEYWNGDIPWITASSLHDFYVRDSIRKVTHLGVKNGTRLMPRDTVIFVVRGMSLKSEFRVGIARRPVAFGQDCKAIIAHDDVDPLYLANLLRAKQSEILRLVSEASHGTGRLETDALKNLKLYLPPLPIQRRIAEILGRLDDKIEVNRRINRTLEQMAQALYKHWFVDFGPFQDGEFVESEVGLIPAGWSVKTIGEVCKVVNGSTPSTKIPEYWEGGEICWTTPTDMTSLASPVILDTSRKITQLGLDNCSASLLPVGSVLMTSRATLGVVAINYVPMATNQGFKSMICGPSATAPFMLLYVQHNRDEILSHASGTTFLEINSRNFKALKVVIPPLPVMQAFTCHVQLLFDRIHANEAENVKLAATRDYLLPKLLSGAVDVSGSLLDEDEFAGQGELAG